MPADRDKADRRGWLLDTGWGCGYVETTGDLITKAAPIFRKMRGQNLGAVVKRGGYYVERVPIEGDNQ